jgi:predicted outer membrane protein
MGLVGATCAAVTAWSEPQQPGRTGQPEGKEGKRAERKDGALATCLLADNQNEVELAQLAQERSQNEKVKEFAQKMEADHTKMIEQLEKFAATHQGAKRGARAAKVEVDVDANDGKKKEKTAVIVGDGPREERGGPIDFVALKQELAAECLRSARAELESKEGAEFDECYVGMAIGQHMHAIDAMTVFARHSSPEFAAALNTGLETTKQHLAHAKDLMKQLHSQHAGAASRAN